MTLRAVPHLSLQSYIHGQKNDQLKFVDQIMLGLKEYGFIVLKDHPIPDTLLKEAYELSQSLFALPLEKKMNYFLNNGGQRGYTPYKTEHAKNEIHADLKEFWHVGQISSQTNHYPNNVWPSELVRFKEVYTELYTNLEMTANYLLEAIGRGLDVPKTYFSEMIENGNSILRLIHYPPTAGENTHQSIRSAAHEDINLITLLVGATASGLQLLDRNGKWLNVESGPGEIVVDTGDMLARITNNILPATTHRVINPDLDNEARFSMPFFVHPHSHYLLKTISSCDRPDSNVEPILAQAFLEQRLKEIGLY